MRSQIQQVSRLVPLLRTGSSWQYQAFSAGASLLCELAGSSCSLRIRMLSGGRRTENHLARLIYPRGSQCNPKTHSQLWVCCQSSTTPPSIKGGEGWDGPGEQGVFGGWRGRRGSGGMTIGGRPLPARAHMGGISKHRRSMTAARTDGHTTRLKHRYEPFIHVQGN